MNREYEYFVTIFSPTSYLILIITFTHCNKLCIQLVNMLDSMCHENVK